MLFIYIIILSFVLLQSYFFHFFDSCSKALKIFLIYPRSIESHQLTSIFANKLCILAFALLPLFLFNAFFYDSIPFVFYLMPFFTINFPLFFNLMPFIFIDLPLFFNLMPFFVINCPLFFI